jgi:putative membrane protein
MNWVAALLLRWALATLPLWVASYLFPISFETTGALLVSGLLLGLANAFIRPIVVFLTFPLTIVTLGFFILVINALMLLLVAWLVPGFHVGGFWTGFLVALFVSIFSFLVNRFVPRVT